MLAPMRSERLPGERRRLRPCPEIDDGEDSLDHLVGSGQQRFRDCEAERLGGLEVDDEFQLGRLLDRQIGWFLAFENAPAWRYS